MVFNSGFKGLNKWKEVEENDSLINRNKVSLIKGKGKVHPCTGTEALYRPYGP